MCPSKHKRMVQITFDIIECNPISPTGERQLSQFRRLVPTQRRASMDEPSLPQKLVAEALGTAFLVFIGVGLGARHPDRQRRRAVHDGRPRDDLPGVRHHRGRHRLRARPHRRQPHQPGGHRRPGGHRQVPVVARCPPTSARRCVGAIVGAAAIIGVLGMAASDVGPRRRRLRRRHRRHGQAFTAEFVGTFILVFTVFGVIHRKAPAGFAGVAIGLVVFAAIIPVAPDHRRLDQPGPHLRSDARPADRRRRRCSGASCPSTSPPSSSPASSPP